MKRFLLIALSLSVIMGFGFGVIGCNSGGNGASEEPAAEEPAAEMVKYSCEKCNKMSGDMAADAAAPS